MLAERPAEYVKVVASILPKQLEIKENTFDGVTDEQLEALIAAARSALGFVELKDVTPVDQAITECKSAETLSLPVKHLADKST
jgi:hypothetical protein